MSCAINTACRFARGTTIAVCPAPVIHTSEILNKGQKNFALMTDKRQKDLTGSLDDEPISMGSNGCAAKVEFLSGLHGRGSSRHRQPCFPNVMFVTVRDRHGKSLDSPILQNAVQSRRVIVDDNRRAARRYFSLAQIQHAVA